MNLEAFLIFFQVLLSLPQKIELDTFRRSVKKPSPVTISQCSIWLPAPLEKSLNPGKSVRKYGFQQRTSFPLSPQRSSLLSDTAPSQSKLSFPLSHSRSDSPLPGNHTPSSMLLSYHPIKKQKSMVRIIPNPLLTSTMVKKNMKLKLFSPIREM
jgi:hypothetical protein